MTHPPDSHEGAALIRWMRGPLGSASTLMVFLGYTILMIMAIPFGWLRSLRYPDRPSRGWNEVFHRVNRSFLALIGVRYRIIGGLRPDGRASLYAANHGSWLDGCFFQALMERDGFAVTAPARFFPWPFSYWLERVNVVQVARTAEEAKRFPNTIPHTKAVALIARRLKAGESGLIFPEGHLERSPHLQPFKTGAVRAALLAGAPLVPVSIRGSYHALSSQGLFLQPHPVTITFHSVTHELPIGRPELADDDDQVEHWTLQLMHRIGHKLEDPFDEDLPPCDCRSVFSPVAALPEERDS